MSFDPLKLSMTVDLLALTLDQGQNCCHGCQYTGCMGVTTPLDEGILRINFSCVLKFELPLERHYLTLVTIIIKTYRG